MSQTDLLAGMRTRVVGPAQDRHATNGELRHLSRYRPEDFSDALMVEGIIWDMDGTCVQSEVHAMASAFRLTWGICDEQGVAPPEEKAFMRLAGRRYDEIIEKVRADLGCRLVLTPEEIDQLVIKEEELAQSALRIHATAIPGVVKVLELISDLKIPFALASNSCIERMQVCLEAADLTQYFPREKIFSAVSDFPVSCSKPRPEVYNKALNYIKDETGKQRINLKKVVAVEDSTSGFGAAKNAGVEYIIAMLGGEHIPKEDRPLRAEMALEMGCHEVIYDMNEFPTILNQIGTEIASRNSDRL